MATVNATQYEKAKRQFDNRQVMTDQIIQELNNGTLPWQRPWPKGLVKERPFNPISHAEYKGMNLVALEMSGYGDPRWMTFKHAEKNGYKVKKSQKGTKIEFWQMREVKEKVQKEVDEQTGEPIIEEVTRLRPAGRTFVVFNADQIDGLPAHVTAATKNLPEKVLNERAENLIKATGAKIMFDTPGEAFFDKHTNIIHVSPRHTYNSTYDMYSSILHQLAHWTSCKMGRKIPDIVDDKDGYMREELRVEFACYFLAHDLGIGPTKEHIKAHAACIAPWVTLLKSSKNEIYKAAREGEKIFQFLMEYVPEYRISRPMNVIKEEEAEKQIEEFRKDNLERLERQDREDRADREEREEEETKLEVENKKEEVKQEQIQESQAKENEETKKIEEEAPETHYSPNDLLSMMF